MILSKENFNINPILLTNLVFGFFPISFVLGNFVTNVNLILFCILGIIQLRSKILTFKFNLAIKIIFLFFLIVFFSTSLNFLNSLYLEEYKDYDLVKLVKSLIYFRFFLFLVVVYLLSETEVLDLKYFFLSATFITLLLSLDIIFQYIFGFDIIGNKSLPSHNSGFFGDELIAGSFIKNFSFFSIFFLAFLTKDKKFFMPILIIISICIFGTAIIFSGNKMPFILFLLGLFLIFLFKNKLKKVILASLLILFTITSIIFSFDEGIKRNYSSYYRNAYNVIFKNQASHSYKIKLKDEKSKVIYQEKKDEKDVTQPTIIDEIRNQWQRFLNPPKWKGQPIDDDFEFFWVLQTELDSHYKIYLTAMDIWSNNKIFGNGIKSFREECKKLLTHKIDRLCSNHPHNYYIEILVDTGILGFLIVVIMGFLFILFIIKNFKLLNDSKFQNLILFAATISLILEAFPIKSTGSIFTTNNATYLILIASIIVCHKKLLNNSYFK